MNEACIAEVGSLCPSNNLLLLYWLVWVGLLSYGPDCMASVWPSFQLVMWAFCVCWTERSIIYLVSVCLFFRGTCPYVHFGCGSKMGQVTQGNPEPVPRSQASGLVSYVWA